MRRINDGTRTDDRNAATEPMDRVSGEGRGSLGAVPLPAGDGIIGDEELWSFAAITDEPPPEIAAAGHDRCIVPIKGQHIDAWLDSNPKQLDALYAILEDRERPVYEYRRAREGCGYGRFRP